MQKHLNILKYVAWAILCLWLTRGIFFKIFQIDFATIKIAREFRTVWLILVPVSIGILIINSWKSKTSKSKKEIGLLIGFTTASVLMMIITFFSSICEWQFNYVQYEHRFHNMKIQTRFVDCGATTSGEPYELVVTKPIGKYLVKYRPIKENEIHKDEWLRK